jgi:hypothetical protein
MKKIKDLEKKKVILKKINFKVGTNEEIYIRISSYVPKCHFSISPTVKPYQTKPVFKGFLRKLLTT